MPMQLLRQLAMHPLPVEVRGDDAEKVIVLTGEDLIAAAIKPNESAAGSRGYHAIVLTVTPAGQRAAKTSVLQPN